MPTGPQGNACCQCMDSVCTELCECASPDTPIATPTGERAIATLQPGDLVYTVDHAQVVVAPIAATHQTAVGPAHRVVRVRLANGALLEISRGHPTLDGRTFADLRAGGSLGGVEIVGVESVPYGLDRTYDILPASDSGGYFANGVLIGSTLKPAARVEP
jgi:Hint domain